MKGIFIEEKRNEAIERLAIGIVKASENCVTVIKKINSISQNPEKYPNPSELILVWHKHLFTNDFHDFIDEWISPKIIDLKHLEFLQTSFFNYLISIVPFYYDDKVIYSPNLESKKHKWSENDYLNLKKKIFEHRYSEVWNKTRIDNPEHFDRTDKESISSLKLMTESSQAKRSKWKRERKIKKILATENLNSTVNSVRPKYNHTYQTDIFEKYSKEFIDNLPGAFDHFDTNFYEVGTYLHKYFVWCNE